MTKTDREASVWQRIWAWLVNAPKQELQTAAEAPAVVQNLSAEETVSVQDLSAWETIAQIASFNATVSAVTSVMDDSARLHLAWEDDSIIYHAFWQDGQFVNPVPVAMGKAPVLAIGAGGGLHLTFTHRFIGQQDVYHVFWDGQAWTLPRNVSNTTGVSTMPAIAVDSDKKPHVVWSDTLSGPNFPRVYHATIANGDWINAPVPNSRGTHPAIAVDVLNRLHVVWQDKIPTSGENDIFHIQRQADVWSVAENVSDTPNGDSVLPQIACAENEGHTFVVWEEFTHDHHVVSFSHGQFARWSWSEVISDNRTSAHWPRIGTTVRGCLHTAWVVSDKLYYRARGIGPNAHWGRQKEIANIHDLVGLSLSADADGQVHLSWADREDGTVNVYYRQRKSLLEASTLEAEVF